MRTVHTHASAKQNLSCNHLGSCSRVLGSIHVSSDGQIILRWSTWFLQWSRKSEEAWKGTLGSSKNAWLATGLFNFQQWPIPCMHACLTHPHQTRLVYRSLKIQNNALLFLEIQLTPSYITVSSRMKYAKRHQHLYFFHKECSFSIQILFQKIYNFNL